MQRRRFGTTDLEVFEITFGAMRFVPGAKGNPDEAEGRRALALAIERGVDTIHSSHRYGTRYALDKALKDHPKRHELEHLIKVHAPDYADPAFDAAGLRDQIELGLKELHTDRIDVVQHLQRSVPKEIICEAEGEAPRISEMPAVDEGLLEAFAVLKEEGKVGHLVTFPHTPGLRRGCDRIRRLRRHGRLLQPGRDGALPIPRRHVGPWHGHVQHAPLPRRPAHRQAPGPGDAA